MFLFGRREASGEADHDQQDSRTADAIERSADRVASAIGPGRFSAIWLDPFGRLATRCVQILAVVAVAALVIWGLTTLSLVLIPVVLALILACAMRPFIAWLRRRGVGPMLATWITLAIVLGVFAAVIWLITWTVQAQWENLVDSSRSGIEALQGMFAHLPFDIQITQQQLDEAQNGIKDYLTSSQFGSGAIAGISATASFFTGLFLLVVVLFFFLKDGPAIWEFLLRPFEGEGYARGRRIGDKAVDVFGGYVRGTAIVAAVDAIGIGAGLAILQVPLFLPLAVVVFVTAFIPIVGATIAGILAALVTLVTNGPVAALIVIGIVVVVNQLEGNLLQPVVMGRTLQLHSLIVLLALTAGSIIGGIVGAVLAVPIAAVVWGIISVWDGPDQPARIFRQKRTEQA